MSWGRLHLPEGFRLSSGFPSSGISISDDEAANSAPPLSFASTLFLTEFLDNLLPQNSAQENEDSLSQALKNAPQARLSDLLQALPTESSQILQTSLGPARLLEISQLSRETDPELFREQVLNLAQSLEREDRLNPAMVLLQSLKVEAGSSQTEFQARVDRELGAIVGQGEAGVRFEFLLRRFAREASDPWMIAGFGAGSLAFQATRLGVLSRFGGLSANWVTARPVAKLLASAAGLSAEVPAFVFVTKLGHQIGGAAQDWSGETLAHELSSAGLTLFCLKGAGALSGRALRTVQGLESSVSNSLAQATVPQVGMFAGIVFARKAEETLGLRAAPEGATLFADSLATYFQFVVGGRLAGELMGPRVLAWQREANWKAENLLRPIPGPHSPLLAAWPWLPAGPSQRPRATISDLMKAPLMSENHDGDGGGKPPPSAPRLRLVRLRKTSSPDSSRPPAKNPAPEPSPPEKEASEVHPERQQVLDLSAARVLRSRAMADEKSREPENDLIKTLGSAFDHSGKAGRIETFRRTWADQLGVKSEPREVEAFATNLDGYPGYFHAKLSYYAAVNPTLAKVLLAKLEILPPKSPLRQDPELRTALGQRAREVFSAEDWNQHSRGILYSFQLSGKNFFPEKFQPLSESERLEWHEKIGDLPAILVEALDAGGLQSANLLLMAHRLGLSKLGTPSYEYLPVED